MYFQTLDDKSECVGIYADNQLFFAQEEFPSNIKTTWKYASYLRGLDIEYASLYLEGASLSDTIPEYLQEDWEDVSAKVQAYKRSLQIANVNMQENCFYDLVPRRFLIDFCEVQNKITEYITNHIPRPTRYKFYKHVSMMLEDLSNRDILIDTKKVATYLQSNRLKNQASAILRADAKVRYNQFGTRTGRLTTQKSSFPILTLNKEFRTAILPNNDYFLELDFNGAEVRTLLGLLEKPQPAGDVHDFHLREIFTTLRDRDDAKVAFFAWLYGSRSAANKETSEILKTFYQKGVLLDKYYDGDTVVTPYGKHILSVSPHHALNYLVQSTAAELTLKQALKIEHLLRTQSAGSEVAFIIHDAVVLDMKKEDEHLLGGIASLMSSTNFGTFRINMSKGATLGTMQEFHNG